MQPHVRYNWVGLAVAHHVAGSLDEALRVLKEYESTMRVSYPHKELEAFMISHSKTSCMANAGAFHTLQDVPRKSYEHSEVLLYRASIMEEKKDYAEAVDYLNSKEDEIVDVKALQEIKGERCSEISYCSLLYAVERQTLIPLLLCLLRILPARCLAAAGKKDEAEAIWRKLISQNSENKLYYAGLLSVRGIDLSELLSLRSLTVA